VNARLNFRGRKMQDKDIPTDGPRWLEWAADIQAIAQNGLTFAVSEFDKERYQTLLNISAQMMSSLSQSSMQPILDLFMSQSGYATPKIDVRGAIFQEQTVLLVKESADQKWTLPGGWADMNYSPAYCMQKEVFEESGYEVAVRKLVALYDKWKHEHPKQWPHTYKCFFLCEITGGSARTSIETSDVRFFPIDNLPELSLPRVTEKQIQRCYAHYLNPTWPTDFD